MLNMCYKAMFFSKIAQKGKDCSRLLELEKVTPNTRTYEHNWDWPSIK